MPFTVEDFNDLVRILEEKPEWRAALRRQVLTDELLALPEQVASLRAETERRFQELTAQVAELATAQKRTEEQVITLTAQMATLTTQVTELVEAQRRTDGQIAELIEAQKRTDGQIVELTQVVRTLVDDVGELKGDALENRYRNRVFAYFGRLLRRAHVLSPDELTSLLEEAVDSGALSEAEADEVALVDLVVRGRRREDGTQVYLAVEVSWSVDLNDVERAIRRANLLAKIGTPTMPVVAGRRATDEAKQLARMEQVWQLTDGRAVPPEPHQAN